MTKLRQSAKGEECSLRISGINCTDEYGAVVLCHLNSNGKGMGIKSPDWFAVYVCNHCHDVLDGRAKGDFTEKDVLRALYETQSKFFEKGLVK